MWTQLRLQEQSDLGLHCLSKRASKTFQQATNADNICFNRRIKGYDMLCHQLPQKRKYNHNIRKLLTHTFDMLVYYKYQKAIEPRRIQRLTSFDGIKNIDL